MKHSLTAWQVAGFGFTAAMGTLLHFLYDWSGRQPWVGLISGVNESIWEHMKLLFVPMLVFALIESRFVKNPSFWCAKLVGIVMGLAVIPVLYYTYTGALGVEADWFNIAIFFIAAALTYRLETYLMQKATLRCPFPGVFLGIVAIAFGVFTFFPPQLPLFQPPLG